MFRSVLAVAVVSLAGCTIAPTRDEPGAFKLLQQGQINPSRIPTFVDCLVDGFERSHLTLTSIHTRQRRLADGMHRVESMVNATTLVSADVSSDGRAQLSESYAAAMIDTSGERTAFAECLGKVGGKP